MRRLFATASLAFATIASGQALAQQPAPLEAEQLTVEKTIRPGPNVFVSSQSWNGAGSLYIYSADDLSYKGNISAGLVGQFTLAPDGKTAYVTSVFPKRIVYGQTDAVLQSFDVATLAARSEVKIPEKFAQVAAQKGALALTASGRFALVQNATPATSVSIVDITTGKMVAEAPTPGCWSILPALEGDRFSTICGDGTLLTIKLGANGKPTGQVRSDKIFDPDGDPLFVHAERVKGDLLFISYKGVLHRVSDKLEKAALVDKFDFTTGQPGGWAPGGYQLLAYAPKYDVVFVTMHPDAKDGSHKNGSKEIWAVDLAKRVVQYRSLAEGFTHIAVTGGETPALVGVDSHGGKVARFEIDPTARFAMKPTKELAVREVGALLAP